MPRSGAASRGAASTSSVTSELIEFARTRGTATEWLDADPTAYIADLEAISQDHWVLALRDQLESADAARARADHLRVAFTSRDESQVRAACAEVNANDPEGRGAPEPARRRTRAALAARRRAARSPRRRARRHRRVHAPSATTACSRCSTARACASSASAPRPAPSDPDLGLAAAVSDDRIGDLGLCVRP
jgi:hypothetical protein